MKTVYSSSFFLWLKWCSRRKKQLCNSSSFLTF